MTRGNPARWTMKIQYSAITIHLVIRCLIYTQEEVKQPLDTGLENSFMGSHGSVSETEGRLLEWKAAASRPRAQRDPPTQKLLSYSTARKDSSVFHTQRQPCGHLTMCPVTIQRRLYTQRPFRAEHMLPGISVVQSAGTFFCQEKHFRARPMAPRNPGREQRCYCPH